MQKQTKSAPSVPQLWNSAPENPKGQFCVPLQQAWKTFYLNKGSY